jgi:hypothetical protein
MGARGLTASMLGHGAMYALLIPAEPKTPTPAA